MPNEAQDLTALRSEDAEDVISKLIGGGGQDLGGLQLEEEIPLPQEQVQQPAPEAGGGSGAVTTTVQQPVQGGGSGDDTTMFDPGTGDVKRVRVENWNEIERRAMTIRARATEENPITLAEALAMAQREKEGATPPTQQQEERREPVIPQAVQTIRSTIEERKEELRLLKESLETAAEEEPLFNKDILASLDRKTAIELELRDLERDAVRAQREHDAFEAEADAFEASWDASTERAVALYPDMKVQGSALYNAVFVEMDAVCKNPNHELFNDDNAPEKVIAKLAKNLNIQPVTGSAPQPPPAAPAKAATPTAAFRPAPATFSQANPQVSSFDSDALVKTAHSDPDAAADQIGRMLAKNNQRTAEEDFARSHGIRFE